MQLCLGFRVQGSSSWIVEGYRQSMLGLEVLSPRQDVAGISVAIHPKP